MAQDIRPYKSKEQDGQGNEIILRDQQLVEQGNATTMPSGACFETLDVDNRPVKIPRDNMMNIVLECIGIILNDSSKNLGTNVQKALGLQGNTIGHSTVADFASVLGGLVPKKTYQSSLDANTITASSVYHVNRSNYSNIHLPTQYGIFGHVSTGIDSGYSGFQFFLESDVSKIHFRICSNKTDWTSWTGVALT